MRSEKCAMATGRSVLAAACVATIASTALTGADGTSLVTIDRFDDVSRWSVNADGGEKIIFESDTRDVHSGPAAMRVTFGGTQCGNLTRDTKIPAGATAVVFWVRVYKAMPQSAMHVWLLEPDGDAYAGRVTIDGKDVARWPARWTCARVPLGRLHFEPRGNKKRDLLSVNRLLLGFNFAPMEVGVEDIAWEVREAMSDRALPRSASFEPAAAGPSGRVAIFDQPGLSPACGQADIGRLEKTLAAAGFVVRRLLAGDLADPARLSRSNFDLLVLPQCPQFPLEAKDGVQKFLQAGGSLLTSGGYAFDEPVVYRDQSWHPAGTIETAAEIQKGKRTTARINTRFGEPGDAMGLDKTQIGMFDPSYQYERVVRAEIAGRQIQHALSGWVPCITDPTGSPVYGTGNLRFIPLGRTLDRLGRPRGPLGGLAHHFAGPYAGSSWAFFGVTNRDLLAEDGLPADSLTTLAKRLVNQVYLHSLSTDLACYRDGETVAISVAVANRGRATVRAHLTIAVEDQVVRDRPIELAPDGGKSRTVQAAWKPDRFDRDFYVVRATLTLPDYTDVLENAFCAWHADVVRAGAKLSLKDNYFRINDRPTLLTGTNQTGRMWLAEYENPLVWRDDFAGMRDHGMVLWRVLHFSAVMDRSDPLALRKEISKKVLRQTDAIVQLAQKYGVVVFLTMHDWMPVELTDEQLAAQAHWNAFWADRYKDVPGIIYDVQNEPSMHISDAPHIMAEWKRMLTQRYGSIEAAAKRWGLSPSDPSLAKPQAPGRTWTDLKAVDVERFRVYMLSRWVKGNVEAIHRADPDALVTVGYLQGMRPADKVLGVDDLDFSCMHSYQPLRSFPVDFKILDRRAIGKTFTLGEFGQREAHDARVNGLTGDRPAESIQRFMVYNHYALGLGASFTESWCWRDMPDCIFPWGMVRPDHLPKQVLKAYRNVTLLSRFITPKYEAPDVWLILPDAHRLGGMWNELQGAIDRTIDTLLGLRVQFGVLREKDVVEGALDRAANVSPSSTQRAGPMLIQPVPYCPDDVTAAAIRKHVEGGASLYLSGDLAFDETRKPTQTKRLTQLGLKLAEHRSPFEVNATGDVQRSCVGKGTVFFVPYPVELTSAEKLRGALAEFLKPTDALGLKIEPDHPDLHLFVGHTTRGGMVVTLVNHGEPRTAAIPLWPERFTVDLGAPGWGLLAMELPGQPMIVQAQGSVRRGEETLVETDTDVIVVALDGQDLARSSKWLVMPSAADRVAIATRHSWRKPVLTVGEIVGGSFKALETTALAPKNERLELDVDADRALSLILVTEQPEAVAAGRQVAEALTLGRTR